MSEKHGTKVDCIFFFVTDNLASHLGHTGPPRTGSAETSDQLPENKTRDGQEEKGMNVRNVCGMRGGGGGEDSDFFLFLLACL